MRAIDLFNAMQNRTRVYLPLNRKGTICAIINGIMAEDGSGTSWIVYVHDVDQDLCYRLCIRTVEKGHAFSCFKMSN